MNYKQIYNRLIDSYGVWEKPKDVYVERHRKVPGCMGGKYTIGNAFYVPARVHYLCHLLLAKIYGGKNWHSVKQMGAILCRQKSRMYEVARKAHAERLSIKFSGVGHPMYGTSPSEITRKKISEASLGKPKSDEMRAKLSASNLGHNVSKETRYKLSIAKTGIKMSDEFCKNVSERMKGNTYLQGFTHSEETKRVISEKIKGRKHTEEVRKKMSVSKLGKLNPMYGKPSPRKGVTLTEETKQKLRDAALRRNHGANGTQR